MVRAQRAERLDPAVLKLAGILMLGVLAPLLDSTVVNVALDTLGRDLHASVATVQWVTTGYLLALAVAVPISGWTADRFGAKRMWLAALLVFLGGSVLCGSAWDIGSLVAFRVVQGFGGGLLLPSMPTMLVRASGQRQIGRLMAVVTVPALLGPILGPALGGVIAEHLAWRWIFYINVVPCALGLAAAWWGLPADPPGRRSRFDLAGLLLISPALAGLVYGLSRVATEGGFGHLPVYLPLSAGAVLLAGFVVHALRSAGPLIDLRLFANRSFAASTALLFLSGLALFGSMLLLPLYYQQLRGQSVVAAGLLLVPQGVGSLLARASGAIADRIGPRPVVLAGAALTVLGTAPFVAGRHTDEALLAAALVVRGVGLSSVNLAVTVGAFRDLEPRQIPHASSTSRIAQQVGGSLGTAVFAVVLERQRAAHPGAAGLETAFNHTFVWAMALIALAVVPALLLPRVRPAGPADAAPQKPAAAESER